MHDTFSHPILVCWAISTYTPYFHTPQPTFTYTTYSRTLHILTSYTGMLGHIHIPTYSPNLYSPTLYIHIHIHIHYMSSHPIPVCWAIFTYPTYSPNLYSHTLDIHIHYIFPHPTYLCTRPSSRPSLQFRMSEIPI